MGGKKPYKFLFFPCTDDESEKSLRGSPVLFYLFFEFGGE
jgi:hypothetical protein